MIQIDMDIPKTCDDCPFHIYHSGKNYVCVATPLFYPMNLANYKDGRKDFCPLKEVSQEPIIDEVRAEIERQREEVSKKHSDDEELQAYFNGWNDGLKDARDICDEYKADSEDKE